MSKQLKKSDLPAETVEVLEEILSLDEESLAPDEVAFLRARRGYLNKSELARFANVLKVAKK